MENKKLLSIGFIVAGLSNIIAVPIFSKLFTNEVVNTTQPNVMSNFGLVMIMVWGLAYIAVNKNFEQIKWLVAVFAVEKIIYAYVWFQWLLKHELSTVYQQDNFAGVFYTIYGVNDFLFFCFFTYVFYKIVKL
ncbi:hypothetical protein [Lacinutrix chionoecetis]